MVSIRNCGGRRVPERLREVKSFLSGIRADDEQPVDAMISSAAEPALRHLVIARIFMKQTGKNGRRQIRADAVVGKGCSKAFSVCSPALSQGFRISFRLAYGR